MDKKVKDKIVGKNQRQVYIDVLKVIAIICIIVTHDSYYVEHTNNLIEKLILTSAVPIFMIVSGINYANRFDLYEYSFKHEYALDRLTKRLKRFLIPYAIVFICVNSIMIIWRGRRIDIELVNNLLLGGYGPGAYYTPIIVQLIFLLPILYFIISKFSKGICVIIAVNCVYELFLTYTYAFEPPYYSRIIIRYLCLISCGIYLHLKKMKFNNKTVLLFWIFGLAYLISVNYYYDPIVFKRWTGTSCITALYNVPLVIVTYNLLRVKQINNNWLLKHIMLISNATYHIYLTQMSYYYLGAQRICGNAPVVIRITIGCFLCIFVGCAFYCIEFQITEFLRRYMIRN